MQYNNIRFIVRDFYKKLPKFKDGRIDYSKSDIAPVITVFLEYQDKILLLKRSDKVAAYKNKWNSIAGYLDELKPVKTKVFEELKEEIGLDKKNIESVFIGSSYKFYDKEIQKTWIIFPALVKLKQKVEIRLDWEHISYKWIKPKELSKFDIVPSLEKTLAFAYGKKKE
jgi:8-oxo-dGTP diphosphatase